MTAEGNGNGRLLLTADEAAALLGVSRKVLRELAERDGLPYIKVGRFMRFRRESLERWVREREEARQ